MYREACGTVAGLGLLALALIAGPGCVQAQLPAELGVSVPAAVDEKVSSGDQSDRTIVAGADTGPEVLANTHWQIFGTALIQANEDGVLTQVETPGWYLGSITLGEHGEALLFELGYLVYSGVPAQKLFGDAVLMDARTHDSAIPGLIYAAESYGVNLDQQFGEKIYGELLAGPLKAGEGTVTISGTVNENLTHFEGRLQVELKLEPEFLGRGFPKSDAYDVLVVAERVADE